MERRLEAGCGTGKQHPAGKGTCKRRPKVGRIIHVWEGVWKQDAVLE